ncbi:Tumor necrosis factor beta [Solea senegalensis]|uniref:Tumor necrosis factor beta n=1 Tax=Solea senegalensis TaxID=28829 RepID=A0AAV6PP60_SOLSE|nr:Tumor necrosis factor beta [Solea senegalensis]
MSLTEKQHIHLDSEITTHIRMDGHSKSSQKYLLLQVWCGLLTVAMLIMAAFLTSIKPQLTEDRGSTATPENVSPTMNTLMSNFKSEGSSLSYIQLIKSLDGHSWEKSLACPSCSLSLRNDSIHCTKDSLYFLYAQVTFTNRPKNPNHTRSVILKRNPTFGRPLRKLVEGRFPATTESSVWVAKIVPLMDGDSVSLVTSDDFLKDSTFWGAYQLH